MRISDWSSDVCSSDLEQRFSLGARRRAVVKPALAAGNARQIAQTGLIDPLEIEDHVACQQTVATDILDAFKRDRPQFLVDGFKGEREGAIAGNPDKTQLAIVDFRPNNCPVKPPIQPS